MSNIEFIKDVETYTYLDEVDGNPMEVLLIGIDASNMGSDNSFEPTGFFREHITTWLRQRYFFLDGTVFAQIPRQFKHYPDIVINKFENSSSHATNVSCNINDNIVYVYYPISESESICLSWDTRIDSWSMSIVSQPSDETIIPNKGHDVGNSIIWESI